jgi:hypothetical protein
VSKRSTARIVTGAISLCSLAISASAQSGLPASTVNAAQLVRRILLGTDDLPDGPITTLHVYMDLEQIPVLVLDRNRELLKKPIAESRFRVSLDSGPLFKPTHVRSAGDDPISLTILIDTNNPNRGVLDALPAALAALTQQTPNQGFLMPHDHVSIYSLGCSLIRTTNDRPADPEILQSGVDAALKRWREDDTKPPKERQPCAKPLGLWDAIIYTTVQLHQLPGRRVLLVVTDGHNRGGHFRWGDALSSAQEDSVAIFGRMRQSDMEVVDNNRVAQLFRGFSGTVADSPSTEDSFGLLCADTGGMEVETTPHSLRRNLNWWLQALRQRVIIEYPRPNFNGRHRIDVSVPKADLYIRITGATVPIPDPKILTDPSTLPPDPSKAVPVGDRRPLPPSG